MPSRGSGETFQNLVNVIKGINGSPIYWTNFEGRVYNAPWVPEDGKPMLPFATVTLIDPPAGYQFSDDLQLLIHKWQARVTVFVQETSTDLTNRSSPVALLNAHDDVVKAIWSDFTLQDTAHPIELKPGEPRFAGVPKLAYGAQDFLVVITQYMTLAGLGPQ